MLLYTHTRVYPDRQDAHDGGSRVYRIPGSKKNNFFFKMFHGRDSDMFVVIVGQCAIGA